MSEHQRSEPHPESIDPAAEVQPRSRCLLTASLQMSLPQVETAESVFNGVRTESSSAYLLLGEGKHREHFHHNLNDDICHHLGRWNVDIDVESFQEVAQAFEEVQEGIIIGTDFAGGLRYPCVTRGLVENSDK
jgi:predicted cupin superfamily sugar epimerase